MLRYQESLVFHTALPINLLLYHLSCFPKQELTIVVPKVTCDLPFSPIPFKAEWSHLSDLELADPGFGRPGRIDILLGIDVFVVVLLHGQQSGL